MAGTLVRIMRFEIIRMLAQARWLWALLTWLVVAWLAADDVGIRVMLGAASWCSVFDVHAASGNNMLYVGFILLTAFVLVCSDTLARDRETRFAHVVLVRSDERRAWWIAKVAAVVVASVLFQAGFLLTTVGVGILKGGVVTAQPSPIARSELDVDMGSYGDPLFSPVAVGTNMFGREVLMAAYLAFAFAAIGIALLALTVRYPHPWLPVTAALGTVIADRVVGWFLRVDWYGLVSPTLRLLEATHSPALVSSAIPWWTTIVWWLVLGAGSFAAGRHLLARADL